MRMMMTLKLPQSFPIFSPPLDPRPSSSELRLSRWNNPETRNARRAPRPSGPGPEKSNVERQSHPAFRFSNIPKSKPQRISGNPALEKVKISEDGLSYVIEGAPFEFRYSYTETPKVKPIKMREAPFVPFGPETMPRPWTGRAPLPPSKKKLKEFDSFVLPPPHKKGVKPVQSPGPFLPGTAPRYVKSREELLGEPLTQEEIRDLVRSCIKTQRQLNMGRDGLTHNMLDNIHAHWKRRRVCKIRCKGVCTVDMDNVCHQLEERTWGKIIHRKGGVLYLFRGRNYNYKTRPHFPLMLWKPVPPVYPRLVQRVPEGLTLEEATKMRQKGSTLIPICKLGKNGVYCDLVKTVREAFEECELVRINCQGLNKSDYRKIGAKLRDLVPCTLLSFGDEHILMWRGPNWKSSMPDLGDDRKESNKIKVDNKSYKPLLSEALEFSMPGLQMNPVEHESNLLHDTGISSTSSDVTLDKVEVPVPVLYPNENSNQSMSGVTEVPSLTKAYEVETTNNVADSYAEPEPRTSPSPSMTISHYDSHAECPSKAMSESHGTEDIMNSKSCSVDLSPTISGSHATLERSENYTKGMVDSRSDKLLDTLVEGGVRSESHGTEDIMHSKSCSDGLSATISGSHATLGGSDNYTNGMVDSRSSKLLEALGEDVSQPPRSAAPSVKAILLLLEQAVEKGSALVLDKDSLDADNIYQNTVAFAKSAPPGPVFGKHVKSVAQKSHKQEGSTLETKETTIVSMKWKKESSTKIPRKANFDDQLLNVVPQGTLGVDELAKLLT